VHIFITPESIHTILALFNTVSTFTQILTLLPITMNTNWSIMAKDNDPGFFLSKVMNGLLPHFFDQILYVTS